MTIYIQTGTHTSNVKPNTEYSSLSSFLKDYKGQPELVPELDQDPQNVKDTKALYVISGAMIDDHTAHNGYLRRCDKTVLSRSDLLLDLDDISPEIQSEEELLKKLEEFYHDYEFFVWPSIGNRLTFGDKHHGEMRYRVCLPLLSPLTEDDYKATVQMELADFVKNGILAKPDNTNKNWSQCFGLPIREKAIHEEGNFKFYPLQEDLEKFKAEPARANDKGKNKAAQKPFTVPTTTGYNTAGDTGLGVPEAIHKLLKEGPKWQALWNGKVSEAGYDSQSEADLALANKLCFYLGKDPEAIDEAFRSSGLLRDKWDEEHYSNGETYGQQTITKAINGTAKLWSKDYRTPKPKVTYNFGPEILYGSGSFEDIAEAGLHSADEVAGFLSYMLSRGVKVKKAIKLAAVANDHTTQPAPKTTLIEIINTALAAESQRRNGGVM